MTNSVVVDASLAIKWVLPESDSEAATALLFRWNASGIDLIAPCLFVYEIANILHRQNVTGKLTYEEAVRLLRKVFSFGISLNFSQYENISTKAMEFANRFRLPASYDAHYLALAESEQCEYWTADARLLNGLRGQLSWVRNLSDYQTGEAKSK